MEGWGAEWKSYFSCTLHEALYSVLCCIYPVFIYHMRHRASRHLIIMIGVPIFPSSDSIVRSRLFGLRATIYAKHQILCVPTLLKNRGNIGVMSAT